MKKQVLIIISVTLGLMISCESNEPKVLGEKKISKEEFGNKWPLSVDEGIVKCIQYSADGVDKKLLRGVVFEVNGRTYGVNGTAKSQGKILGYSDISEIWVDDIEQRDRLMKLGVSEKEATIKLDISPVLDTGLKLCE